MKLAFGDVGRIQMVRFFYPILTIIIAKRTGLAEINFFAVLFVQES